MILDRYPSDDDFDAFRLAYEFERQRFDHRTGMSDEQQERYDRGLAFARQCVANGYRLEPWPTGRLQPPVGASVAFGKTLGIPNGINKETRRWQVKSAF